MQVDPAEKLTANFTLGEALRSSRAEELGIANTPSETELANIRWSAEAMQAVRDLYTAHFGEEVAIGVTSWFRNAAVNAAVGGSPTSDHLTGRAVDFYGYRRSQGMYKRLEAVELARIVITSPLMFDQLILYARRLHLGFRPEDHLPPPRREVRTALIGGGYAMGLRPENARP